MAGIFEDLTSLAVRHHAVNLGQGFPDFPPPRLLLKALSDVSNHASPMVHQYTRSFGHVRLVRALASLHSPPLGRPVDPLKEVLVSLGAYGALVCAINGLVGPGDDVILIEPFFDCYLKMVSNVGANAVYVTLRPRGADPQESGVQGECEPQQEGRTSTRDWRLDVSELEGRITPRTRAIVLNNPSNPLGKVFSREELEDIAQACRRHDLICISDEAYEWLVYDGARHVKMASLPGMWERTVTIGSAGKMFCATGWKVGWLIAPEPLMTHARRVHQNCYFRPPTPLQEALAEAVEAEVRCPGCGYTAQLSRSCQGKRDRLAAMLESVGLRPVMPEGAYFLLADVAPLLQQGGLLREPAEASSAVNGNGSDVVNPRPWQHPRDQEDLDVTGGRMPDGENEAESVTRQHGDKVGVAGFESTSNPAQVDDTTPSSPPNLPGAASGQKDSFGDYGDAPDILLVRRLVVERGIAAIPLSPFYSQENKVEAGCFLRFCFIKSDVTLDKAEQRFRDWAGDVTPKSCSACTCTE